MRDISFFNTRATNSMVRIATSEGVIEALPSCGHFMGSAEAPKLSAKACERPVTAWLRDTEHQSRELRAVGLDDVFRKLVWDGRDGAQGVRRVLDESHQVLDEALKTGGWARYESKRELVFCGGMDKDGQLKGRIVAR